MEHSRIGGSSTHRFIPCPGSVNMCRDIPSKTSIYAEVGTAAHFVAEQCLKARYRSTFKFEDKVSEFPEYEKYFTEEMAEHIDGYLQMIWDITDYHHMMGDKVELKIEERVHLSWIHEDMFGTADVIIEAGDILYVIDLKYGVGIVEVEDNPACKFYGLGAIGNGVADVKKVELVIYQPRGFHPEGIDRRWSIPVDDLIDWGEKVLKPAAIATEDPDAPLCAGEWCEKTFCPALQAGKCDEAFNHTMEIAKSDFDAIEPVKAEKLSPEKLSKMLRIEKSMIAWFKGLREYAGDLANQGKEVPGHKLVRKQTKRVWKADIEAVALAMLGDELYLPPVKKMRSPSQLEKIGYGQQIQDLWHKPEGALILVGNADKRKSVEPETAQDDFEKLT